MKKTMKSEYGEVEIELVMEAYGVGRTRAVRILREKCKDEDAKKKTAEQNAKTVRGHRRTNPFDDDLISAEEFFGC